ncbi:MAG: phosphatase PAP2 family protein [Myxococcales bacterium]
MRATPVDRLLVGFLTALAVVAAVFVPDPWASIAVLAAMLGGILLSAWLRNRFPRLEVVHAFLPVPILAWLVNLVGPIVKHVNSARWDATLAAIDGRFLGPVALAWRDAAGRPDWLVDAASVAYASHYLVPLAIGSYLWVKGRSADFDRFAFSIGVAFVALYAMYFVAPATGPRVPDALAATELGGGAATAALRAFLRVCERTDLDAFPSGHTAIPLVVLAQCWTLLPRIRAPLAAIVLATVFSTVYLSFHYVTDVVGGISLAAIVVTALPWILRRVGLAPLPHSAQHGIGRAAGIDTDPIANAAFSLRKAASSSHDAGGAEDMGQQRRSPENATYR